ncbi:MAG: DUF1460 domain-containing protein [Actinomycetia bacterium]|nr:DUF1460 domain-containing protein [Actinomycetes bacterium]MCH9700145.1 DUF1460 domain-containing protein [Actinomycetes bacterium]MCH9759732.1 DUF1460 domain-containing protein [Actinomycetes bacterium]
MPIRFNRSREPHLRRGFAIRLACLGALSALAVATAPIPEAAAAPAVQISSQSEQILQTLLAVRNTASNAGRSERSDLVSRQFLGVPYGANTLVGSMSEAEQLVVDLEEVDCFTYADYVEALKRSGDRDEFIDNLVQVRYKNGVVDFEDRKHFFTDWSAAAPAIATDITESLSANSIQSTKHLNEKDSGGVYLPGLPVVARTISYIPSEFVDNSVIGGLQTGDYIGAYAADGGLDVTHVGIFIDTPDGPVLRNASSLSENNKVVDSSLLDYLRTVPGMVVLRPVE